jgi:seryl-tRNA synthetase
MPLDIRLFRDEASLAAVRESERRRFSGDAGQARVSAIVETDSKWRTALYEMEQAKKEKNLASKAVGEKMKKKEDAAAEQALAKALTAKIEELEKTAMDLAAEVARLLPQVGNLVHASVVVSNDEAKDNDVVQQWGGQAVPEALQPHDQLLWRIDGYEPERGVKAAGHRGYFLKGPAVMMNQALITYALQFLCAVGYTPLQPPYFMKKSAMAAVAQLSDFDDSLYHVGGDEAEDKDDTGKYLIATSEQPICTYHMGDWFRVKDELPCKYAGFSTCFRKEAGKHGKDTWGIFRVHQFDKVEQFVLTDPESSWAMHEEMRALAEKFLQSLKLPYRVVNIVSGELNLAASKKYDIEAWFPSFKEYKELVSCSNCTDYQARATDTRFGAKDDKQYVHMLNSTLCALTRTISCILENYQEKDGVRVPDVLVPFMGGTTFIPFVRGPMDKKAPA